MLPAVLALLTSAFFGTSDFVAAITSRRISSVDVALWSQFAGAIALVAALALSGQRRFPNRLCSGWRRTLTCTP
jgi:hypothetical protein